MVKTGIAHLENMMCFTTYLVFMFIVEVGALVSWIR